MLNVAGKGHIHPQGTRRFFSTVGDIINFLKRQLFGKISVRIRIVQIFLSQ